MAGRVRLPEWLRTNHLNLAALNGMGRLTRDLKLHTVCESARCPNRADCFARGTATFMILGDICTRNCTFCGVRHGRPQPPDPEEPQHIVEAVKRLGLRYVVITSVTRDDLPDGGARQFAQAIADLHNYDPDILVEVLVPDFKGSMAALQVVLEAGPVVLNHNVETVPRLYPRVRPGASFHRSLELLKMAKRIERNVLTKSGFMLGLGETEPEVIELMAQLRGAGCDLLSIGQYLPPSLGHYPVARFVPPEEFEHYEAVGRAMGFLAVVSKPLVRSSFQAAEAYLSAVRKKTD